MRTEGTLCLNCEVPPPTHTQKKIKNHLDLKDRESSKHQRNGQRNPRGTPASTLRHLLCPRSTPLVPAEATQCRGGTILRQGREWAGRGQFWAGWPRMGVGLGSSHKAFSRGCAVPIQAPWICT